MKRIKLTPQEVKHIAKLAGLTLGLAEVKKFQKQLSEILNYMEILNGVSTKKVEPKAQVIGLENIFREDKLGSSLSPKEVLFSAPAKHKSFFKTKAVFKR